LPEASEFAAVGRIAHPVHKADRRIAEMNDAGFDHDRTAQSREPRHLQRKLKGREASALGVHVGCCRADRCQRLNAGGGEAVDERREGEISVWIEIGRLYPVAGRRNKPLGRARLGPRFDRGTRPRG
jgi:hypothetical protein